MCDTHDCTTNDYERIPRMQRIYAISSLLAKKTTNKFMINKKDIFNRLEGHKKILYANFFFQFKNRPMPLPWLYLEEVTPE